MIRMHATQHQCAELIFSLMFHLRWVLTHTLRQESQQLGLSIQQLFALGAIAYGCKQPSDLARKMFVSLPAATSMVDTLVEHGLVHRERGNDDRRAVYLSLTDKGRDLLESGREKVLGALGEVVACLEEQEQEELRRLLLKMDECASELKEAYQAQREGEKLV